MFSDATKGVALLNLEFALRHATEVEALDALQPHLKHPDSINDVGDALDLLLNNRTP